MSLLPPNRKDIEKQVDDQYPTIPKYLKETVIDLFLKDPAAFNELYRKELKKEKQKSKVDDLPNPYKWDEKVHTVEGITRLNVLETEDMIVRLNETQKAAQLNAPATEKLKVEV
jgi:hypothetical protein